MAVSPGLAIGSTLLLVRLETSLNSFDVSIISFLNQFSHRSPSLDYFIMVIGSNTLTKGGVITLVPDRPLAEGRGFLRGIRTSGFREKKDRF